MAGEVMFVLVKRTVKKENKARGKTKEVKNSTVFDNGENSGGLSTARILLS
jgi:hypothetical protein